MSRKPQYKKDFDSTISGAGAVFGLIVAVGLLVIKLTYYVALPFYHLFTKLFKEKFVGEHYVNWMRFLPLTWFVTGETKEMHRAAVSMALLPVALIVFLITNQMLINNPSYDNVVLSWVTFISFFLTVGGVIGLVRNYRFSKRIMEL